jgi:hypothetical protein
MNSDQIHTILHRILGPRLFHGVYPADGIPSPTTTFPYGIVVNTDKEGQPGKHWQAIWMLSHNKAEFFDSFGDPPRGAIAEYFKGIDISVNNKKVQANYEISCGPFVIYYLVQRARGLRMGDIIARLLRNKFVDTYVKLFVQSLL